jgi:hypothetical protein|nr:MAG TPA: tail protein [Caudoviricetes sp.]
MAKQSNEKSKLCLPCYTKIQSSEELDDGLVGVNILKLSPENLSKPAQDPDRYKLRTIPATFAEGTAIVGSATFLNKYSQLVGIAKAMSGGPNFVDTRDNKVEIHNGKQSGKAVFAYTYAGGTGELLEFRVQTKYVQSIEAGKASSVDPDTKTIETDVVQCVPTNDDPCKPDAYVRENKPNLLRFQRDVTRMAKVERAVVPSTSVCREIRSTTPKPPVYESPTDAQQKIASNPSLTEEEVKAYNSQLESEWKKYQDGLKEFEDAIRSGKTDVGLPQPPDEVSDFVIKRKVRVLLNPHDYVPEKYKHMYGGNKAFWKMGFRALEERSDITIIYPANGKYSPGNNYDTPGDKVLAEMEVEIQVPGVRVVSDPLFATLGDFMANDIIESVNSQIKSKAKFVGNPNMKSSQIIEIKNVGQRYSGDWYAKEVEHSFDTGGYFTEVTFEKKSRNSILNKISTSVNMQEVFQKAHDVAEESYTTDAWKIPSQIKAEVEKYRESSWKKDEKENPRRAGRQIVVQQDADNPADYQIFEANTDFQVGRNISPKEQ